jgi:hypothetical protein
MISPSILEYWFTVYFSFLLKSNYCEAVDLGLGKSGKILYFLDCCEWLIEMFY